ncbi:MAG: glyoxalase/bleomycin resistance/extradiol dioxygenase family protein [Ferruginibacter sp.]
MKLTPYIYFSGNAEEALNFYAGALNGTIEQIGRYGDSPMKSDEDWKQKIIHSRLAFEGNLLMISDSFKGSPVSTGGNVQLSVDVENTDLLESIFNKMAEDGTITMPLQDTFWGAKFGMLRDKFGIAWMFNCELTK